MLYELGTVAASDIIYQAVFDSLYIGQDCTEFGKEHPVQEYKEIFDDLSILEFPTCPLIILRHKQIIIPKKARSSMIKILRSRHLSLSAISATARD